MENDIQQRLDGYLDLMNVIKEKTGDDRAALVLLQEIARDRRSEQIREEREKRNGEPATDKQKKFMKKLGIDFPDTVTKKEASILIDEELGKESN